MYRIYQSTGKLTGCCGIFIFHMVIMREQLYVHIHVARDLTASTNGVHSYKS